MTQQLGHEEIARRAYELYRRRGAEDGLALQDWLEAERQLSERQEAAGTKHSASRGKRRR